jgi:predicted PurR-regulated permease PerM
MRIYRMDLPNPSVLDAPRPLRDRALGVIATGIFFAILYFTRDVLVPVTLAFILSLLIAPLVRGLRRFGLSHTWSVLTAVLMLTFACGAVATVIGSQLVRMAASLPEYEKTITLKLETLNAVTLGRVNSFTSQAERLINRRSALPRPANSMEPEMVNLEAASLNAPIPVELHAPPANPLQVIQKVMGSIWVPIETGGIVLVVLIFVLLEQEALRDRFIRIAGGSDIRLTTLAINDAGERLSRFFVSQFAVNLGVGVFTWIGLSLVGLPHPLLWAGLASLLRFVPYVGIWIAALCAVLVAAAVDPGWGLTLMVMGLFVVVELIAGQLVEPQLYGHTTGLSPLSVVIAAIFWSWLWGPIGLIVSTPLTLCLLVAGRHIKALSLLDILLGDTQALTMPQRFYQRALSADSIEIIGQAREFMKRNSFADYCDLVLLPALHLARIDLELGAITPDQQAKVRSAMVEVIAAIAGDKRRIGRRFLQSSVLRQTTAGRVLREQRERSSGRWQGPLNVPPGSVVLCVGLGSMADELATELLVRILRDKKIDARHMALDDLGAVAAENKAELVSLLYLVSAFPSEERGRGESAADNMRTRFPEACIVAVYLPGMLLQPEVAGDASLETIPTADKSASSLHDAVEICMKMRRAKAVAA